MNKKENIAVIGGGIIGVSTAFYLQRSNLFNVTLFDDNAGQATKATGGIVSPWLSRRRNKTWYQLVKTSAAFYPSFVRDLGLNVDDNPFYKRSGSLLFTKKDEQLEEILNIGLKRREDAPEIGDLRILNPDEIKSMLPIYTGETRALYASGGAKVDGKNLIDYMSDYLASHQVNVINKRVHAISVNEDESYTLSTHTDKHAYDKIVLSNGAWSPKLLEPLGYKVDNQLQKGQISEVVINNKQTADWPVVQPAGGFNVVPFSDGHILIGATHEKESGYTLDIIPDLLEPYLEEASRQISTAFDGIKPISYRVGVRGYTHDFSPYFGKVPHSAGIYTANGMGATGLTAGPLVGKILAQLISGEEPILDPKNYHIEDYIQKI